MEKRTAKQAAAALAALVAAAGAFATPVPAELFGQNIEHTRSAVQGGLSAQLVRNRKFAGKPSHGGVMQMWEAYGTRAVYAHSGNSFTRHAARSAMFRQNETGSQEVQGLDANGEAGISQDRIALRGGVKHEMKVALSTFHPEDTAVVLRVSSGARTLAMREFTVNTKSRGDWTKIAMEFTPPENVFATISIGVKGKKGISLGAVSLLPGDNFRGMRADVAENLREIGASIIRWPGGNFAGEYRWRDGLVEDPDMRAPIQSYTEIETQPHSLGYDSNDIGMEDILALCDKIGAKPFFTINAVWEKPSDSADWVKACKGRVKMWSLGNEMGYGHMEGSSGPEGYNKLVRPHAEAMLKADPSIKLVASGLYPGGGKNWIEKSAKPLSDVAPCISYHGYDSPGAFDFTSPERVEALFAGVKTCVDSRLKRLGDFRAGLPRSIGISYDEWNIWYSWYREEGIVQGLYAARMLTGILKGWEEYGLDCVCYFQPVNEGAIEAGPFESHLTSIGEAMRLMKGHVGGEPCDIDNLPAEAFVTDAPDGTRYMTFFNHSTVKPATFRLPSGGRDTVAGGELLLPDGLEPGSRYVRKPVAAKTEGGFCEITLPPAAIASVRLAFAKTAGGGTTWTATVWRGETAYIDIPAGAAQPDVRDPDGSGRGVGVACAYYDDVAYELKGGARRSRPDVYREIAPGAKAAKTPAVCRISAAADAKSGEYKFGPLTVAVLDRVLPPPAQWKYFLDLWQHPWAVARYFGDEPFSPRHFDRMRPVWRTLAGCGVKTITTTILDLPWNHQCYDAYHSMIARTKNADGSWRFDYSVFDRYVEFAKECGLGPDIACYTMCPWGKRTPEMTPGSKRFDEYWGPFLADFAAHLKEKGWFADTYIAMDERAPEDVRKIASYVRSKAPGMKIAMAGNRKPSLFSDIGIENFSVGLSHLHEDFFAEIAPRRAKGYKTTYYVCCNPSKPNTFMESGDDEAYWNGAFPALHGFDGMLRWAANSWPEDPYKDASFRTKHWKAGDTYLVYPGGEPSARLIALRAGVVAAEKLRILKECGDKDAIRESARLAAKYGGESAMRGKVDWSAFRRELQSVVNSNVPAR